MENGLRPGLQLQSYYRLSDPVRHSGNPQHSGTPTMRLRYFHRPHRRREVGPRGHTIPDAIEVIPQITLEILDGLPIHPGSTLVRLDPLIRLPYELLRYLERLHIRTRLAHSSPPGPSPGCSCDQIRMSQPLRSTPITRASPLLRAGPPARHESVLDASQFPLLDALPLAPPPTQRRKDSIGPRLPAFSTGANGSDSRRLHAGHRLANKRAPARLIPGLH
jgi:hypothetical protein